MKLQYIGELHTKRESKTPMPEPRTFYATWYATAEAVSVVAAAVAVAHR